MKQLALFEKNAAGMPDFGATLFHNGGDLMTFTCKPAGDQAILVEFENKIDEETNARVRNLASLVEKEAHIGYGEVILGFRSFLIHYDPGKLSYKDVKRKLL